jgi:hypothetical protein
MSEKGKKLEPPLHLDMDFGEALERFARTKPAEVAESIERSKQKKPPGEDHLPERQATPDGLQRTKRKR